MLTHTNPTPTAPLAGTATTLPPGTNVEDFMNAQLAADPNFQPPAGYHVESGQVVRDQPGFLLQHPWLIPALGIGAGVGATALLGPGAATVLGPSTAANISATTAATAAPAGIAAPTAAGSAFASLLSKQGLGALGHVLTGAAQASANNRTQNLNTDLDLARLGLQGDQFNESAQLAQAANARAQYNDTRKNSIISDYLSQATPTSFTPNVSSYQTAGYQISPELRAQMAQAATTQRNALPGLATTAAAPMPAFTPYTPPTASSLPTDPGWFEKYGGLLGLGLGAFSALKK
jgi:hypothetical protein